MSDTELLDEVERVRAGASCLVDATDIALACDRMAVEITEKLSRANPLLLGVMNGGIVPLAMLLQRLEFALQVDYVHLTRYGMRTTGGEMRWVRRPPASVRGRTVLIVDDLLDHGITLEAIVEACEQAGAAAVQTAVLITKQVPERAGLQTTDYSALTVADEYIFGYGMDYKSYLRNARGIYAVSSSE